ncbi:MAG: undecaprenyl/decaprenyl-phosphate alpha-N-acetylglucosaminyl 1-phosphate transferase [Planctomycetes bacterium]|nr:undecaprenyl/decaprenyl-phosphate alpha-N-acetylglucosaminyl 1-phosphate transferase [Planctomycetota bacterium]
MARRWGFVDRPDGHHKGHGREVALGGGLAVFLAAAVTFLVEYVFSDPLQGILQEAHYLGGLLLAGAWIVGLGLYDDRFGMRGRYKLLGQVVAAAIVISAGLEIKSFVLFEQRINLGPFSVAFTIFWLLGAMNSLNLLDGIDGLAGVETATLGLGIALVAATAGMSPAFVIYGLALLAGALGFLWWNWHPARIFLGDVGSVPLGFLIGWLLLVLAKNGHWQAALILPLYFLADATITLVRRALRGEKVWQAHREHFYQQAVRRGLSHADVVRHVLALNLVLVLLAVAAAVGWGWVSLIGAAIAVSWLLFFLAGGNVEKPQP